MIEVELAKTPTNKYILTIAKKGKIWFIIKSSDLEELYEMFDCIVDEGGNVDTTFHNSEEHLVIDRKVFIDD